MDAWRQLTEYRASGKSALAWQPGWIVFAVLAYAVGLSPSAWFWWRVLLAFGQRPTFYEAVRAYYVGHLGKYVPGKAWAVLIRAALVRSKRTDASVAAAAVFVETLTMMAVGAFLAAGYLVVALREQRQLLWAAAILVAVAGIPTLPPVFKFAARWIGRLKRDEAFSRHIAQLDFGLLWQGWGATFVLWLFLAASLWATLKGLGVEPVGAALFPRCVATAALATVAGFLILVLPGGLGVREAILVALIAPYLEMLPGTADRAELIACVTAALLRLEWVAAELGVAGVLYVARPKSLDVETANSVGDRASELRRHSQVKDDEPSSEHTASV